MVEHRPGPRPALDHVEPVEVPNEAHGGSVKPLSTPAVHELCLGPPGEEEENQPGAKEVGADEAWQHGGEKGEGREARRYEEEVPEEVDQRWGDVQSFLVAHEGAEGAMVHGHTAGDGWGRSDGFQHCGGQKEELTITTILNLISYVPTSRFLSDSSWQSLRFEEFELPSSSPPTDCGGYEAESLVVVISAWPPFTI